jgi:hypothetical protein
LPRESYVGVPRAAGRQNCTGARDTQTDPVLRMLEYVSLCCSVVPHPPLSREDVRKTFRPSLSPSRE